MDLLKVVEALTEDLSPEAKAKALFLVSSVMAVVEGSMKGVDVERVGQLVGHQIGGQIVLRVMFRRAMRRSGLPQYAAIGNALALGAQIAGTAFETGRANVRTMRAEMEAAGAPVGAPRRRPQG